MGGGAILFFSRTARSHHQRRSRHAVRHGLTAETVIGAVEDAEDYKAFEAAITADYDAQSAVERELVLRLASLLWRLRRATTMETGLFEIQAEHLSSYRQTRQLLPNSRDVIHALFGGADLDSRDADVAAKVRKPALDLSDNVRKTVFNLSASIVGAALARG